MTLKLWMFELWIGLMKWTFILTFDDEGYNLYINFPNYVPLCSFTMKVCIIRTLLYVQEVLTHEMVQDFLDMQYIHLFFSESDVPVWKGEHISSLFTDNRKANLSIKNVPYPNAKRFFTGLQGWKNPSFFLKKKQPTLVFWVLWCL